MSSNREKRFCGSVTSRVLALVSCVLLAGLLCAVPAEALYIDIVSSPRKMPIAVMDFTGPYGEKISEIISSDIEFSGFFAPLDPKSFVERPGQAFRAEHWSGLKAEAVVKGEILPGKDLTVVMRLYDVVEGKVVLEKKYTAGRDLLRPLSHSIADDIYQKITGRDGVFRTKLLYLSLESGAYSLNVADWDGERSRSIKSSETTLMSPRWHYSGTNFIYSQQRGRGWDINRIDLVSMSDEQLLLLPGINLAGDFFPDGDRFVFTSSKSGSSDIYTYYVRRMKLSDLATGFDIEVSPSISPDGEHIVYVSDRSGSPQIYTMDKFGYNKARLTFEGSYNTSPAWSPRGDLIAFSGLYEGKSQVYVMWPEGTGLRRLTEEGNNEEPTFSPDGRFITFTSDRHGDKGVYIMRTDGEGQRRITPAGIRAYSPRWSPK